MAFTAAGIVVARRVIAGAIDVPGISSPGFHVDNTGNLGVGGTTATSGPFTVDNTGNVIASAIQVGTITGVSTLTWGSGSKLGPGDSIDLPTSSGFNTPARVQGRGDSFDYDGVTVTQNTALAAPATAGNLIVVSVVWGGTMALTVPPAGFTNSAGTNNTGGGHRINSELYWKIAAGGEQIVGVTFGAPFQGLDLNIAEYSNIAAVPTDKAVTNTGSSTNPNSGTTAATTQTVELVIAVVCQTSNVGGMSFSKPTNGFSIYTQMSTIPTGPAAGTGAALLDRVVSSTGAYGTSVTSPLNGAWVGQVQTFKASGPGSGVSAPAAGFTRVYGTLRSGTTTVATVPAAITDAGSVVELVDGLTSITATASNTNNTNDTLGPSVTIPANTALQGGVLELYMFGDLDTSGAPPNYRWRVMLDGAQVRSFTFVPTAGVTNNVGWEYHARVTYRSLGAGGTFWLIHSLYGDSSNFVAANRVNVAPGTGTVAIDTTGARTIDIRCNMQAAVAGNVLRVYGGYIRWAKY